MNGDATLQATDFDVSEQRFESHLRGHVNRFLPQLNESKTIVRFVRHVPRLHSQLFEFQVTDGSVTRTVIYKAPIISKDQRPLTTQSPARPRLFPDINPIHNVSIEYQAMKSVDDHFSSLRDERFGSISVFDLLESPFVVVMEKCPDRSLKSLLKRTTRFHRAFHRGTLNQTFVNCGAWLRECHTMPDLPHTESRHADRGSFVEALERFTDGLIDKLGRRSFFDDVRGRLSRSAARTLPATLPCVVVHGDYAPRNILVDADSRVTVLDTTRRWRAPVYEDLAYMLMSVKIPGPQVRSLGLLFSSRQLATWESSFLQGYFLDGSVPLTCIRLYECLLTLEWWAATNFRQSNGTPIQRARLVVTNRYLTRYIERLLLDV